MGPGNHSICWACGTLLQRWQVALLCVKIGHVQMGPKNRSPDWPHKRLQSNPPPFGSRGTSSIVRRCARAMEYRTGIVNETAQAGGIPEQSATRDHEKSWLPIPSEVGENPRYQQSNPQYPVPSSHQFPHHRQAQQNKPRISQESPANLAGNYPSKAHNGGNRSENTLHGRKKAKKTSRPRDAVALAKSGAFRPELSVKRHEKCSKAHLKWHVTHH